MKNRAFRDMDPLPAFWLLLVQPGEGCDYTIGCGVRAEPLKAATLEGARKEADAYFMGKNMFGDLENMHYMDVKSESALSHVVLVSRSEFLPLEQWRKELVNLRLANEAAEKEAVELAELARLQAKYGKKP